MTVPTAAEEIAAEKLAQADECRDERRLLAEALRHARLHNIDRTRVQHGPHRWEYRWQHGRKLITLTYHYGTWRLVAGAELRAQVDSVTLCVNLLVDRHLLPMRLSSVFMAGYRLAQWNAGERS